MYTIHTWSLPKFETVPGKSDVSVDVLTWNQHRSLLSCSVKKFYLSYSSSAWSDSLWIWGLYWKRAWCMRIQPRLNFHCRTPCTHRFKVSNTPACMFFFSEVEDNRRMLRRPAWTKTVVTTLTVIRAQDWVLGRLWNVLCTMALEGKTEHAQSEKKQTVCLFNQWWSLSKACYYLFWQTLMFFVVAVPAAVAFLVLSACFVLLHFVYCRCTLFFAVALSVMPISTPDRCQNVSLRPRKGNVSVAVLTQNTVQKMFVFCDESFH